MRCFIHVLRNPTAFSVFPQDFLSAKLTSGFTASLVSCQHLLLRLTVVCFFAPNLQRSDTLLQFTYPFLKAHGNPTRSAHRSHKYLRLDSPRFTLNTRIPTRKRVRYGQRVLSGRRMPVQVRRRIFLRLVNLGSASCAVRPMVNQWV